MADPIAVMLAIKTGAETVSSVCGAIEDVKRLFGKRPAPSDPIAALRPYLQSIDHRLAIIEDHNRQIIQFLNALPDLMRRIVREELVLDRLDEKYLALRSLESSFMTMDGVFDLSRTGWPLYADAITNVAIRDPRIGQVPTIVKWFEFGMLITEQRATGFIQPLLSDILDRYRGLLRSLESDFTVYFVNLEAAAKHPGVTSTTLSTSEDVEEIAFEFASDAVRTVQRPRTIRVRVNDAGCCAVKWEEQIVYDTVTEPDVAFNESRDAIEREVNGLLRSLREHAVKLREAAAVVHLLQWYEASLPAPAKALADGTGAGIIVRSPHEDDKDAATEEAFLKRHPGCYE